MITNLELSQRVYQFFDVIFGAGKTQFGFNALSKYCFIESQENQAVRKEDKTILFYQLGSPEKIGNAISSDTQIYNRENNKEEILAFRKISVIISILSKEKGKAKDAMNAFLTYLQSARRELACYSEPFAFVLVNHQPHQDFTGLEEGAWVERIDKNLEFRYNDLIEIGDIQFTQEPAAIEDVKDIIQYDINLKY
jgi:hypothetical protein